MTEYTSLFFNIMQELSFSARCMALCFSQGIRNWESMENTIKRQMLAPQTVLLNPEVSTWAASRNTCGTFQTP
jgi:hypothetical protein